MSRRTVGAVWCALVPVVIGCQGSSGSRTPRDVVVLDQAEHLPEWAVPFGREPWRRPADPVEPQAESGKAPVQVNPAINLGDVMERVGHAIKPDERTGIPAVRARTYWAAFDAEGFVLSPYRPLTDAPVNPGLTDSIERHAQYPAHAAPDPDTAVAFRTLEVMHGDHTFYRAGASTGRRVVVGNTAQARLAEDIVEHMEARTEGVEVTWVIKERPRGHGELVIRVEVAGLAYAGSTDKGMHFADADGVARVRVGRVNVVDAKERRWNASVRAEPNGLRVSLRQEDMDAAVFPLAIDPIVGPEFGMDEAVFVRAVRDQRLPKIAAAGSKHPILPGDLHNDRVGSNSADVFRTRMISAESVMDASEFALSPQENGQQWPAVASNGTDYLVVWSDLRSGFWNIFGARVNSNGAVLDVGGIAISTAANHQAVPKVASNGTDYLVVWNDVRVENHPDIHGARVTSAGSVLDASGIAISTAASYAGVGAVASNGTDYLVVWFGQRGGCSGLEIKGTRVTSTGSVLDGSGIVITTSAMDPLPDGWSGSGLRIPSVASNGTDYIVVWTDVRSCGYPDIYGTRVTSAGSVLDSSGIAISTAVGVQQYPSVASNGTDYFVVWHDNRLVYSPSYSSTPAIYGTRVTSAGSVLDASGIAISTPKDWPRVLPSVTANGNGYLVVWAGLRSFASDSCCSWDVYGTRVTSAGLVVDEDPANVGMLLAPRPPDAHGPGSVQVASRIRGHALLVYQVGFGEIARARARLIDFTSPTLETVADKTVAEGDTLFFSLHATDSEGNRLSCTATNIPAGATWDESTATFTWTPNYNDAGLYSNVTFSTTDGTNTTTGTMTITVTNTNRPPVLAPLEDQTVAEGATLTFTLSATDPDTEGTLTYAASNLPPDATVNPTDGTFTWTPGYDQAGIYSTVEVSVTDGEATASKEITITVTNTNRAPVLVSIGDQTVEEDATLTFTLSASDPDGDAPLSFAASNLPPGASFTPEDGTFTWTPGFKDANSYANVHFSVTDGESTTSEDITIMVTNTNRPPRALPVSVSTAEDQSVIIALAGEDDDGEPLSVTLLSQPAHGALTGIAPDLRFVPALNFFGEDGFDFTVSDGKSTSAAARASIRITAVNDAPVASPQSVETVQGQEVSIHLAANDVDFDLVSYRVVRLPEHGTLSGGLPYLTYRPDECFVGDDWLAFTASDEKLWSNEARVDIHVLTGDAGSCADGGMVDAGAEDSGIDAGEREDASVTDAALPQVDAGFALMDAGATEQIDTVPEDDDGPPDEGCGCGHAPSRPSAWWLLLGAVALASRVRWPHPRKGADEHLVTSDA